jgi:hypothetical protein
LERELKILQGFDAISLGEMDEVALLDRHDTKYIFNREELLRLLPRLQSDYKVLEVLGKRASAYTSLYFDSDKLDFYSLHQRGKKNRVKIRMRQYVDSALTFLEIKLKNNKGRTVKSRIEIKDVEEFLSADNLLFVQDNAGPQEELQPQVYNEFNRITLVHKTAKERLTLDIGLIFRAPNGVEKQLNELVIAELKQDEVNRYSTFAKLAKKRMIRPERISKYCLGIALLKSDVKKNQIKEKLLRIAKLSEDTAA